MATRIVQHVSSEERIDGGIRITLEFGAEGDTARVPSILLLPTSGDPVAAAVLLHGYSSHKEQMAASVGRALLRRGMGSLAIDLPLHGERVAGTRGVEHQAMRNPLALASTWKLAQREVLLALGYLAARAEVDRDRIALIGYSMGSFLGVHAAAASPLVRALVLAAGGDLPDGTPFTRVIRMLADPLRAVRRLEGKPLLMVHGRHDRTITAAQTQRLFDAAGKPKELRWWDSGHYLPEAAIADAATWLEQQLPARARA
jgi:uncharacterized protein